MLLCDRSIRKRSQHLWISPEDHNIKDRIVELVSLMCVCIIKVVPKLSIQVHSLKKHLVS